MIYLFGFSLFCLLLAMRLAGPLRFVPLMIATPILLAVIGTVLMTEFDLTVAGALLFATLALLICIGLPTLAYRLVEARNKALEQEKQRRINALRRHLEG